MPPSSGRIVPEARALLEASALAHGRAAYAKRVRHLRFTLDAPASTQSAQAEVDLDDFVERDGLAVPTRFFERVLRPLPIDAHRWHMTGLDLDRGYGPEDLTGRALRGKAAAPAAALR